MNLAALSNPNLAAMLRGYAVGRPDFAPLAEEVSVRLCAHAERAKTNRPSAHGVRTDGAAGAQSAQTEGGLGGGVFGSETPLVVQNQGFQTKDNTNQPEVRTNLIQTSAHRVRTTPSPKFLEFWESWPKHERKTDRAAAYRVWVRDGLEAIADSVVAAVGKFKVSVDWTKDGGAFIPAPEVWLNKKRYLGAEAIRQPGETPTPPKPSLDFLAIVNAASANDPRRLPRC